MPSAAHFALNAAAVSLAVQGNISSFVCGLVIGGALVAWGLVPYLKAKSGRR